MINSRDSDPVAPLRVSCHGQIVCTFFLTLLFRLPFPDTGFHVYNSNGGGGGEDDHQRAGEMGSHNNGFMGGNNGGYGFGSAASGSGGGRSSDYPLGAGGHNHQLTMQRQWYDEPLYANDSEDFYVFGRDGGPVGGPGQQGRRQMTNHRREQRNGVISLRSAGDISLPQNGSNRRSNGSSGGGGGGRRQFQGNGDYSGSVSDIQSVTSRMSSVSVSAKG